MPSIQQKLKELEGIVLDIIDGFYTQPTSMGPNTLNKSAIKARSIRGTNIDVSNLEAVQTKTGSLTVDGNLTIGTGGSLRSGKTSYSDTANAGFWMGIDSGLVKARFGNVGHTQGWTWDGSTLSVTGSLTATTGTIGGWTITSTDLRADAGAIGLASTGSTRIWVGNTTPGSAPFRVSSAGDLTSTSGSIGGWTIDSTGLRLGSGTSTRGMDTGSIAFYAGGSVPSTAPFRVGTDGSVTMSNATITGGALTANAINTGSLNFSGNGTFNTGGSYTGTIGNSGGTLNLGALTVSGTITIGSGGKIVDADGSEWSQSGITLNSSGSFGDTIVWKVSTTTVGGIYAVGPTNSQIVFAHASGPNLALDATKAYLLAGSGVYLSGNLYPGTGSAQQTSYYIQAGGSIQSNGIGIGGMLGISSGNTINFVSPGTGGSAGNWSSGSLTGEAGYFTIQIAGTNYRVPFYANA